MPFWVKFNVVCDDCACTDESEETVVSVVAEFSCKESFDDYEDGYMFSDLVVPINKVLLTMYPENKYYVDGEIEPAEFFSSQPNKIDLYVQDR